MPQKSGRQAPLRSAPSRSQVSGINRAPGTCLTTRRSPESAHAIGDPGKPPVRPSSHAPGRERSHSTANSFTMSENPANTSPKPGRSPAAVSARVIRQCGRLSRHRCDWIRTGRQFLKVRIGASQAAAERPVNPPPITAKSTSWGIGLTEEQKSILQEGHPKES